MSYINIIVAMCVHGVYVLCVWWQCVCVGVCMRVCAVMCDVCVHVVGCVKR